MRYDYLIVGAGLFGAVCAHELSKRGKRCLVIEKNPYVGGNCHTETREGILIHSFGPHIFHTNNKTVWDYANRFATFHPYHCRVKSLSRGRVFSFPINMMTLHQLWGVTTPHEASQILASKRIPIKSPKNFKEYYLSTVGEELYNLFVDGYTRKQWKTDPENLDISLAKRLPVRLTFDDRYHDDIFQGIPLEGYTFMVENMLKDVEVKLSTGFDEGWKTVADKIIFTGRIDQYYNFRWGNLPYRTTTFKKEWHQVNDFQGCGVINFPDIEIPYTRAVEYKHLSSYCTNTTSTIVVREYPLPWDESQSPLYPSLIPSDIKRYEEYTNVHDPKVIFGGRLGTYSYLNMDTAIELALGLCDRLLSPTSTNI